MTADGDVPVPQCTGLDSDSRAAIRVLDPQQLIGQTPAELPVELGDVGSGRRLAAVILAGIDHALHLDVGDSLELQGSCRPRRAPG